MLYYFPPILASGAIDYEALVVQLTFNSDTRQICNNISIINDDFYENSEDFTVFLSTIDTSVIIDPTRKIGTAVILDDDGKYK